MHVCTATLTSFVCIQVSQLKTDSRNQEILNILISIFLDVGPSARVANERHWLSNNGFVRPVYASFCEIEDVQVCL